MDYNLVQERLHWVLERRVVFVTGITRVGTVWVQHALDAHPQVRCRGEGHFLDALRPLISRVCQQYDQHNKKAKALIEAAGSKSHALGLTENDANILVLTAMGLVFSHMIGDDDVDVVGERTPEYAFVPDGLVELLPKARVVHVVRDGRDEVTAAWEFNLRTQRKGFTDKFDTLERYATAFAEQWGNGVVRSRNFGRAHPGNYLEIRYEDIAAESRGAMKRLADFLEIEDGPATLSDCAVAARGWALQDEGVGQWRRHFSDEARFAFARRAGELLKLLGYET